MLSLSPASEPKTTVDVQDIRNAYAEVAQVDVSPIFPNIANLWKSLRREGFQVSDRKWRNSLRYLQANAWLDGRTQCTEDDLEVLCNMFWQDPGQIKSLRKIVLSFANPLTVKANEVWDSAVEELARIRTLEGKDQSLAATELNAKLTKAKRSLANWVQEAIDTGKSSAKLKERLAQVAELNTILVKEILLNI
jgi:MoxR-like ATPase